MMTYENPIELGFKPGRGGRLEFSQVHRPLFLHAELALLVLPLAHCEMLV